MSNSETTKCKQIKPLKSGWSRWQMPIMEGYKLQCCGCDLVHDVEFTAMYRMRKRKNGYTEYRPLPLDKYRVRLRMKREDGK